MDRNRLIKLLAIILVVGLALWSLYPSIAYYRLIPEERELKKELKDKTIHLGLDLQGGMHLVLMVDTKDMSARDANLAVDQALTIIRNRIDQFGVTESLAVSDRLRPYQLTSRWMSSLERQHVSWASSGGVLPFWRGALCLSWRRCANCCSLVCLRWGSGDH